jgi:hypothetical protein
MGYYPGTKLGELDAFDDTIKGSFQPDYIDGFGGDDYLFGMEGGDIIEGGWGDDHIFAADSYYVKGWGNDTVDGGPGEDYISYDASTDDVTVYGGADVDKIYGGSGNDHLYGGLQDANETWKNLYYLNSYKDGGDTISGGGGNDYIDGGSPEDFQSYGYFPDNATDYLSGDAGNDLLICRGWDYGSGGSDNDVIQAMDDSNSLWGGSGFDTFAIYYDSHHQWIHDFQGVGQIRNVEVTYDKIGTSGSDGTASNYLEATIAYNTGYDVAFNTAKQYLGVDLSTTDTIEYMFITDGVNGYFFGGSSTDGPSTSAVLNGLDELSDFSFSNIVHYDDWHL